MSESVSKATGLTVEALRLPGVRLVKSRRFDDARGWFTQSWQREDWRQVGVDVDFMQDNLVYNPHRGTLRGLHWQAEPHAQTKLVRCLKGALLDVVADVTPTSPTFGQWEAVPLTSKEGEMLLIPAGYAHGYVTTEDDTLVLYKVDAPWCPMAEASCRWNDPFLNIDWGVDDPILSEKDRVAPLLFG